MATYIEAQELIRLLTPIIEKVIERQSSVRSSIKAQKAVVQAPPDTDNHTVAIKFLPELFDADSQPMVFPYNPCLTESDLEVGKAVFVFYSQSLSKGVVMQNATWTAGGAGGMGGKVTSVNGQTGDVELDADDLSAVSFKPQMLDSEQQGQARENIGAGQTTVFVDEDGNIHNIGELFFEVTKKAGGATTIALGIQDPSPVARVRPPVPLSIDDAAEVPNEGKKFILKIE